MPKLLEELKRRNVIRVSLAYLVLSWLLLQVADVLFEALRLDESALTLMVAILALGFIPVVVFSWIYELTPEGVKRESEVDRSQSVTAETGQRLNIAIVVLLVVALGFFAWDRFIAGPGQTSTTVSARAAPQGPDATRSPRSIAVLPFADMSAQGDQAYFADGISEELLNVLARVEGLKVAARTSSFKFRGDEHDIAQIGQALNVDTVLEGSVRKAGNQVRITAQLIDVAGGFHIWSESYDRTLDNIFAVQDQIASAIVDALKLTLQLEPKTPKADGADSGEAYDLYLRGRELAREPSKEGLLRAVRYFEQALAINPDFAPAHGAIASAWIWLEDYGGVPSQEAFDRAEPAARRALELDPDRADALTAMGFLEDRKYQNSAAARDYFERALKANPTFIEAYTLYADTLADLGEMNESLQVRRTSVERDPLSSFLKSRLASSLSSRGRLQEAEDLIQQILAENPEDTYGYEELANLRFIQGRLADSIKAYRFVHEHRPGDPYSAANIAAVYALMEDYEEAERWVDAARARGTNNRWELEARKSLAEWRGDWDAMFRAGQLNMSKDGASWQGQASLGQGDWEAARASFQRTLSNLDYRPGDELTGSVVMPLTGLALAENRLGLESWAAHADAVRAFIEGRLEKTMLLGSWPNINIEFMLARLDALAGNAPGAVQRVRNAYEQNFLQHSFIEFDPFFERLRDNKELKAIAGQMRERALAEREALNRAE